jgi:hypothetical protein
MNPKEKAASYDGQSRSTDSTITAVTAGPQVLISDQILRVWFGEAQRIAAEFRRTGKSKYLKAFCLHVAATLTQVARNLP